jgi:hypothetical protein
MARVWTWNDPGNPPEPDSTEPDLRVRTTKRNYLLERADPVNEPHRWRPVVSPANEKDWGDWLQNWGPLTADEP